jgi:ABC-type antimicrobial peptide transport system permease subunit
VIVALAFGIGANAAMLGVVDRLRFRPYPYMKDPSTVHRIYLRLLVRGAPRTHAGEFPFTRYTDIKNGTSSFTYHAAFLSPSPAVGVGDAARERRVGVVSAGFWDFFAERPALGRFFTAAAARRGAGDVVRVRGCRARGRDRARTSPGMQPLLFKQSAKDPVVYLFVGVVMLVVALVASASPAARAARADPNAALRAE